MNIKSQKDFFAGLMFMAVGVAFAWGATTYKLGTAARMGQKPCRNSPARPAGTVSAANPTLWSQLTRRGNGRVCPVLGVTSRFVRQTTISRT